MDNIFILTIKAGHDFDNQAHQSAWRSRDAAWSYAEAMALPVARASDDPEWAQYFYAEVEEIAILG